MSASSAVAETMDSPLPLAGVSLPRARGMFVQALERRVPAFSVLHSFFKRWLRLDLTQLLTAAALMGAASSGARVLQETGFRIYWWIVRFMTASVSIPGADRLNHEVIAWLAAHVLSKSGTRILTATKTTTSNDGLGDDEKGSPVHYWPAFRTVIFFHQRNLFMVRRIRKSDPDHQSSWSQAPDEYAGADVGDEPLVVMCLGRSVQPIQRFLDTCCAFADTQRDEYIMVCIGGRAARDRWSANVIQRPLRPLESVHFDEGAKAALVADIENYLLTSTRRFYSGRGIPYRRGYLLYGPPGTGKTSLALALASRFGLDLYLIHMPSIGSDAAVEDLFFRLPPRCLVLLEDIDAVRMRRGPRRNNNGLDVSSDDDADSDGSVDSDRPSCCTLAGLLNVLDGVASPEGRIVLMTSNFADKLDKALIRPGRIDKMVYLGYISQRSCELMFLRMYAPDLHGPTPADDDELKRLALDFGRRIPNEVLTPAQVQGYLLNYRDAPREAVFHVDEWARGEARKWEAARERERKQTEANKRKRERRRLEKAAKLAEAMQTNASDEN